MPGRTKKRKPKRRKPFSRKRARRRRRRPASRPLVNTPSSDEDFVLDGDAEGSSSGSTDPEDSDEEEDSEEEEEEEEEDQLGNEVQNFDPNGAISRHRRRNPSRASNGLANATSLLSQDSSDEDFIADIERASGSARDRSVANRQSAPSRPRRHQRHRVNELDEDFDNDVQRSLEDNGIGREALPSAHASGSRHRRARQNLSDEDFDIETERVLEVTGTGGHANHASHPARVRRRHRRQESSDEDFEVDMERILESSFIANGGAFASRPVTRAMDSFLVSDLHDGGPGKFPSDSEARGVTENSAAQEPSPQEAHTNFGKRGGSVVNDTESDKRKGKEKVLEGEESTSSLFASETLLSNVKTSNADEETAAVVCGICWTEMVVAERGKLDSCDHFFCFGCIMEWAKVESRCPMCKQRFTTIARSGTGKSKRIRTIRIPLRDQVYIPPEDPDLPPEDPYADIVCMECHGTGDEGLLLLCDHCDSAAHTFCVGLGRSVPRGDWYCRECQALIGGISGSEDEAEELVSVSGEEEEEDDDDDLEDDDTESILRAIVASVNPASQRTRQTRVQRRSTSTSRSVSLSRNGRARFWQRLSRRQRGRHIAAPRPRLSQAARALLSSTAAELDQAPRTSEAPPNGQARTVPQQRRLHERINEMRNNWGRIQNGDLQFDALRAGATRAIRPVLSNPNGEALRTEATGPVQLAVASNSNVAPIPTTPSLGASASDKRDVDSVEQPESSTQRDKDLQRAWQMMSHAQHLSAGIGSSKSHQQKLGVSPSSSTLVGARQPTKNTTSSATSNLPFARTNLEISSCIVPSPPLENGNAGLYEPGSTPLQVFSNLKHDEIPLRQVSRPTASLAMTSVSGECRKEELPCPSNSKQSLGACTTPTGFDKDSCRPAGGKHTVSLQGFKPEPSKSSRHFERKDAGILQNLPENMRSKDSQGVSGAKEKIDARSSTLPPHEGLKVHLTELVKKQTWPVYLAERLDKEQFKRIARTAVHSLLALCDPNNKSMSLSCVHFEDQGNDPVVKCCKKCLDQHVEKAVKIAKDKIIPS